MSENRILGNEPLPPSCARHIDEVCDRFETAWRNGQKPQVEEYLADTPEPDRLFLLRELLRLEIAFRQQGKKEPELKEYLGRFPSLDPGWLAQQYEEPQTINQPVPMIMDLAPVGKGPVLNVEPRDELPPAPRVRRIRCPHCSNPIQLIDDRPDEVLCPGCGSSFRVRNAHLTSTVAGMRPLGKFQLLERVGLGAFGAVWRARDTELDRIVALKIPHEGLLITPGERERFNREARAAAQLRHPGIVTVHEVTILEGLPILVSDFIEGAPLKDFLQVRPFTFRETAALVTEVAEALDYAHQMGLVHRDIKPANIMMEHGKAGAGGPGLFTEEDDGEGKGRAPGRPVILDFGLALRAEDEVAITLDGQLVGTPAYMSPEQAAGQGHQVDRRSDVYSLGVILYELLCGELPFRGSRVMLLHQVMHEEPRPTRRINDKVPRDLDTICLKALNKAPGRRYASARELADDLRRFSKGEPIRARPVGQAERLWRWCRRNQLVAALLATLVLVFAGGFAGVTRQWLRAEGNAARILKQEAQERQRLATLRAESQLLFDAAEKASEQEQWQQAELRVAEALAKITSEPDLADLKARAEGMLGKIDRQLAREEEERQQAGQQVRALGEVKEFRRLADEMQFYAAGTDPVEEHAPYYDPQQAERAARAALGIAQSWGPELEQLPLAQERAGLRKELSEVLLLLVQLKSQQHPEPKAIPELLALLDRASVLDGPSRSYYRLRAECHRLLGDAKTAAEEKQLAESLRTPATLLDHFLLGEQYRTRALSQDGSATVRTTFQPSRDLLPRAIDEYRLALAIDSRHYWSHFQMGRCYLSLGQGAEAVGALGACVALRPESPWGYSARGLTLALLKRFPEAEQDLKRALDLSPDFRPARLNLGVAHWLEKKQDEALADFEAVLQPPRDKRLIEAAYYRGQLHLERGKYHEALEDFNRVVDENPAFGPAYLLLAQVQLVQGQTALGLKNLNAFLAHDRQLEPTGGEAHERLGRLLRLLVPELPEPARQKECALLAVAEMMRAVEWGDRSPALLSDLGAVLEYLGQTKEAIQIYAKGLEQDPENIELLIKRGWANEKEQQYEQAEGDFGKAAHLDPQNAEAHTGLGYIQASRGAPLEAQREAASALLHKGDDSLVLHNVACIYATLSQSDDKRTVEYQDLAMALLRRTVELWRSRGAGPNEIELIKAEKAFPPSMHDRADFRKMVSNE